MSWPKPGRLALALAFSLSLAACGSSEMSEGEPDEVKGGETWDEYDDRRDSYEGSRGTFAGRGCTEDCSGHEAGYNWAEDKGITDPDDCGGKSWSFQEGCEAYAEEQSGDLDSYGRL